MARFLSSAGFRTVHCTPHRLVGAFEATTDQVMEKVALLQRAVDAAGIHLELLPGMEYYLDEFLMYNLKTPLPLGGSKLILVEAPLQAIPPALEQSLRDVCGLGFTPLVAHPERCQVFFTHERNEAVPRVVIRHILKGLFPGRDSRPAPIRPNVPLLDRLRQMGCRFQADIGSFAGLFGSEVRDRAVTLLGMGIYTQLGSDAHRADGLSETVQRGLRQIEDAAGLDALKRLLR